ncbi:MAG: hypothetical protein VYE64_07180 [Planctomycetota bacterium]|nr:hypothetical protein [Planctomycetota bacterium]
MSESLSQLAIPHLAQQCAISMSAPTTETILAVDPLETQQALSNQLSTLIARQETLERVVDERFQQILERLEMIEQNLAPQVLGPAEDPAVPSLDWEAKKQAIYLEHGMMADPGSEHDSRPTPLARNGEPVPTSDPGSVSPTDDYDPLTMSDADRQEIDRLKAELHEKLREAEVELSISRAKIVQESAQLEEERRELEKRASQIEPSSNTPMEGKKTSMLDRLSRHMLPARKTCRIRPPCHVKTRGNR